MTIKPDEDVRHEICAICGDFLGDEEWYFGNICPEAAIEAYAHRRCVA
jgi:hypothetical protein